MAIIGKIRDNSWMMLILIGLALVAFIFTDYSKMTGNNESVYGFGTIKGEKVDMNEFNKNVDRAQVNADRSAAQQQQPSTPVDRDQVWRAFTDKLLLDDEFAALGIDVSPAEFDAFLYGKEGFEVLPEFIQGFTDEKTGMFNEKLLQSRIEEMETSDDPEVQQQWNDSKEYYIDKRKQEKYFAILRQGMYVTDLEAKNEYLAQKEVKSISYVVQRYTSISDDDIKVTDEKLKEFYEENKNDAKYSNKFNSRDVRFFSIDILPSGKDSTEFDNMMAELKENFATTTNDSLFVVNRKNSDFNYFSSGHQFTFKSDADEKAKQRGLTYPVALDSVFKNASIGTIVGPYNDNGGTRLAKVIGFNSDLLSVRHILIAAQKTDTAAVERAQAKVDSLMPLINKDNFGEYVINFSEDPGSKETGGKYEDFMDYEMVPEFSDFAKSKSIGTIGYVQTDFGFHIMEVLDKKVEKAPILAIVQKSLKASQETIDDKESEVDNIIYLLDEKISPIEDGYAKVAMFDTIVAKEGYFARPVNIQENSPKVYGFETKFAEDKLLKLAFSEGAQVGDLIDSPIKEKNKYVIAILSSIKEEGTPSFEAAKAVMEREFIQAEKAKRIKSQMLGAKSLEEVTKKVAGTSIAKADVTFANPQIQGAGYEPAVVGSLFSGLKDGQRTLPLEGKSGVYVIQIDKTVKAPAAANYQAEKDQLLSSMKNQLEGTAKKALAKFGNVVDNRRFFDTNIRR
ncbi:MAG TPA: hypothetical protein EYG86_09170 [Crocinitomicaceae bacterium]|nr:hypothetical protein [Crocinitomicaceae bacterium]